MKCRDAREMIRSYLDNGTDPLKDKLLVEHINSCEKCRDELNFLMKYRNIMKEVKPVPPPDNFMAELHRKIELEKTEKPLKKILTAVTDFISGFNFPLEAAGVLAVAAVVFFLYKPFFHDRSPVVTSEYTVTSPAGEMKGKNSENQSIIHSEKKSLPNPVASHEKNISSGKDIRDTMEPEYAEKETPPLKNGNLSEQAKTDSNEKSGSIMKRKSMISDKEESEVIKSSDTDELQRMEKIYPESKYSSAESIFKNFNATLIKKDNSPIGSIFYMIKVQPVKYTGLMKSLRDNFQVEEKIVRKTESFYEIELLIKKNENRK